MRRALNEMREEHPVLYWWSFVCFASGTMGSLLGGALGKLIFGS